jgi:hypothetical protein
MGVQPIRHCPIVADEKENHDKQQNFGFDVSYPRVC